MIYGANYLVSCLPAEQKLVTVHYVMLKYGDTDVMSFENGATKEEKHLSKALSEEKDLNPEDYSSKTLKN